ncbi:hypothetical protein [Absiella sp. AM54-8XD]|uniref:hypothetical protein n=1 Tax=Absiella sp. AM54-8XD TaxID=2292279 RepID=UPI001F47A302|nr:hypothetical protein [Absiella sp. AM54-8XD]
MSRYWNEFQTYSQMSVEELQRKAKESSEKAKSKGKEMHPVIVQGRKIANSWWGQAWCNIWNDMPIMQTALIEENVM